MTSVIQTHIDTQLEALSRFLRKKYAGSYSNEHIAERIVERAKVRVG